MSLALCEILVSPSLNVFTFLGQTALPILGNAVAPPLVTSFNYEKEKKYVKSRGIKVKSFAVHSSTCSRKIVTYIKYPCGYSVSFIV